MCRFGAVKKIHYWLEQKIHILKSDRICRAMGLSLLVVTAALQVAARTRTEFATWYVHHVYSKLVLIIGRIFGSIPFPAAEPAMYILFVLFIVYTVCFWGKPIGQKGRNFLFVMLPMAFFIYTTNCGINYYAESFTQQSGIRPGTYTEEDLKELCLFLVDRINETPVPESYEENKKEWKQEGLRSMTRMGEQFPDLGGFYPMPKEILNAHFLSAQQLCGLYTPFTMEVYFNGDMPDYNIPHTICHELFHSRGFMREDEANFIGYLACITSDNQAFRYSGYLTGWAYAGNALAEADLELYRELSEQLKPQARADLEENNLFWNSRKGIFSEASNRWRDIYLKMNNQPDGIHSYDGMVELMLAYYINEK